RFLQRKKGREESFWNAIHLRLSAARAPARKCHSAIIRPWSELLLRRHSSGTCHRQRVPAPDNDGTPFRRTPEPPALGQLCGICLLPSGGECRKRVAHTIRSCMS